MKRINKYKYDAIFLFVVASITFVIYDDLSTKERIFKMLDVTFAIFFWFYIFPFVLLKIFSIKSKKKTKK